MSWTATDASNSLHYTSICSDASGENISVCAFQDGIYTYTLSTPTWTQSNAPIANWASICSNSDGTRLAACIDGSGIWIRDISNNWSSCYISTYVWRCICSDSTGQYLNAVSYSDSYVYSSGNFGSNWYSNIIDINSQYFDSICSDSTGQYLKLTTNGNIYSCSNGQDISGQIWAITNPIPNQPFNSGNMYSICSDSTGEHLAVCDNTNGIYTCNNGYNNSTWTQQITSDTSGKWTSICSNQTGQNLAACTNDITGQIFISSNSGITWTSQDPSGGGWSSICSNYNGTKLFACSTNNGIQKYVDTSFNNPSIVTNIKTYAGDNMATLTWVPSSNGGIPITHYCITTHDVSYNTDSSFNVSGNSTNIAIHDLSNNNPYYFGVQAVNIVGISPDASSNTITPVQSLPNPPLNIYAVPSNGSAIVLWEPPFEGKTEIIGYNIICNQDLSANTIIWNTYGEQSRFGNVYNLSNNTFYNFYVESIDASNNYSTFSNISNTINTTSDAPTQPINCIATQNFNSYNVTVTWTALPPDTSYNYFVVSNPGFAIKKTSIDATSIIIPNLDVGTIYTFRVIAFDISGCSIFSDPSNYVLIKPLIPKEFITNPSPLIQGQPGTLTYFYINNLIIGSYILRDGYGNILSNSVTFNGFESSITFTDVLILHGGLNTVYIYNIQTGQIVTILILDISTICFKEGTKILCLIDKKEVYIPIESIKKDTHVKIYNRFKNEYKKAIFIVKNSIVNSDHHTINKLYKLSKSKYPKLLDDLYVTGSHAILYDKLSTESSEKMNNLVKYYNNYEINITNEAELSDDQRKDFVNMVKYYNDYQLKILDKHKLIAYFDPNFEEVNEHNIYNIYHIVLENPNKSENYGIYANGILAESTCETSLYRLNGYEKINSNEPKLKPDKISEINNKLRLYITNKMNKKLDSLEDIIIKKIQMGVSNKNKSIRNKFAKNTSFKKIYNFKQA
jgi:hypothetical protein